MKKLILTTTAFATLMTSTQTFAASCDLEKQTIQTMKTQISAIDSQLGWAKTNRNATAINGIGTLMFLYANLKGSSGITGNGARLYLGASVGITALNAYNVYIANKDVQFYQDLAESVKKGIEDKEAEVRLGLCISDKVKKSKNEKAQELYTALVQTNKILDQDVQKLESQLGNLGEKASTVVNVGASILFIGGAVAGKVVGEGGAMVAAAGAIAGAMANTGSQLVNLPSLMMSAKEARLLLSEVKKAQEQMKAQEAVLREVLN